MTNELRKPFSNDSFANLPKNEYEHLHSLWRDELQNTLKDYSDFAYEGMGGSGIVISGTFSPLKTRRAIKLPRHRIYSMASTDDTFPKEDPELAAMEKVSHPNIIKLHASHVLTNGRGVCSIIDYIESKCL